MEPDDPSRPLLAPSFFTSWLDAFSNLPLVGTRKRWESRSFACLFEWYVPHRPFRLLCISASLLHLCCIYCCNSALVHWCIGPSSHCCCFSCFCCFCWLHSSCASILAVGKSGYSSFDPISHDPAQAHSTAPASRRLPSDLSLADKSMVGAWLPLVGLSRMRLPCCLFL